MVLVEIHSVEIDRCTGCGGIVLDKGETDMIQSLGLGPVIESGITADHEHVHPRVSSAHCHECKRDMIALRGAGDVEYDWCEHCERLFFDRGELTTFDAFIDA